jgi:hypothetical protein
MQAKLSPTPPGAKPPALPIESDGDPVTARLEQLLLQLADKRAGSDQRLGSALDELRSRLNGSPNGAHPAQPPVQSAPFPHIESLQERVADLAKRVQRSEEAQGGAQNGANAPASGADLDAQFRDLNAALEASLNSDSLAALESGRYPAALESGRDAEDPPRVDSDPSVAGLPELQAIADRLQSIEGSLISAGARSARIDSMEAQLSELLEAIGALSPQIEQVAQRAAVETASLVEASQPAAEAIARLDAMQQDLHSLTQRAGRMDERTLSTLEAISNTLQRLVERMTIAEAAAMDEPRTEEEPPEPGDSRRATRNTGDSRRATRKPGEPPQSDDAPTEQPEEETEALKMEEEREALKTEAQEIAAIDPAPAAEVQADCQNSSAIAPHAPLPRRLASEATKPGKILVFAAVVLLIVSAGLLYGQLTTRPAGAPNAPQYLAPMAPTAPAPAEPPIDHKGSHAQDPGSGGGNATAGGRDENSLERGKTQEPTPKLETIPAYRFDRASMAVTDLLPSPGLVLKSQSH